MALAACGSDSGGSSSPQDEVAVLFADAMSEQDVEIDVDCAKEAASDMSDEDAQAIVDAGPEADADFSPAAGAFAAKAISCVDIDSLIDEMVEVLGEDLVDGDCLKEALKNVDPAVLDSGDLPAAAEACFSE
ncbi:MAG: hypothetical protein DRJ50_05505 [Actinobacteria bacterium]|nr:MAG: hypothetical protein DRJ50_05505 [Actinomycetota bacterium]